MASNRQALLTGLARAQELGFKGLLLSSNFTGEARVLNGMLLAACAREVQTSSHPLAPPYCLICGGKRAL